MCVLLYPLHTVLRVHPAPGFPCALSKERDNEFGKAQVYLRRGNEDMCPHLIGRSKATTRLCWLRKQ